MIDTDSPPGSYATHIRDTQCMKPKGLTETQVQRAVKTECEARGIFVAHVPNGAVLKGNARQRGRQMEILKANGLKTGFPDLVLLNHKGQTGYIECKREKGGRLSGEQKAVGDWMRDKGHLWAVVSHPDQLADILSEWNWI